MRTLLSLMRNLNIFWIWMHYNFRKSSWQLEKFSKNNCCHHYNILSLLNLMNRNQFISKCGLTINNNKLYFIFTPFCLDDFISKSSRTRISFWLIYVFEIRQNWIKNFPEVHCGTTVKVKGEGRTLTSHNGVKTISKFVLGFKEGHKNLVKSPNLPVDLTM